MKDVETIPSGARHVATEVYLKDLNKWVFVDGQFGAIPTLEDVPLNAVEFSAALEALQEGKTLSAIILSDKPKDKDAVKPYKYQYFSWIKYYLYCFNTSNQQNGEWTSIMLTPTDAKHPTVFQIDYPLVMDTYTDSVVDFYPVP